MDILVSAGLPSVFMKRRPAKRDARCGTADSNAVATRSVLQPPAIAAGRVPFAKNRPRISLKVKYPHFPRVCDGRRPCDERCYDY
eukprot:3677206-Pleurochrysis_carterae.AAC.3